MYIHHIYSSTPNTPPEYSIYAPYTPYIHPIYTTGTGGDPWGGLRIHRSPRRSFEGHHGQDFVGAGRAASVVRGGVRAGVGGGGGVQAGVSVRGGGGVGGKDTAGGPVVECGVEFDGVTVCWRPERNATMMVTDVDDTQYTHTF
jgi:hypothetical protein